MSHEETPPTILLVDDNEVNLDILVDVLGDDYDVAVAMDGPSALEMVEDNRPDLILLDVMMPGMDGLEVCRRLQAGKSTKDIPVIFVTALGEIEDETKGFDLGAVDYITKPISPPLVLARVKTHLALQAARRDLEIQNEQLAHQNIQLRNYNQLRENVERITHHDLKTPLHAVLTVPTLLSGNDNLNQEQRDMLAMLEESGYRMLDIINSSMDLVKMEMGQYRLNPEPVEFIKILGQIRGETRDMVQRKDLRIKLTVNDRPDPAEAKLWLPGEKWLLYSMMANLIKNAVEASPPGETILIELTVGQSTIVRVINKGVVPVEIRDDFFNKFVTYGKKNGTGLGAYSAKLTADTLGGRIAMAVSEQDQTTTITIELPGPLEMDRETPPPPVEEISPAEQAARGLPILVVDDYASMRSIIKGMLRSMGYSQFLEAEDGVKAIDILNRERVGLIISDINMPGMDGLTLLRRVRSTEAWVETPFLLVTGEVDREVILQAGQLNVTDYILKPFPLDALKRKLTAMFQ